MATHLRIGRRAALFGTGMLAAQAVFWRGGPARAADGLTTTRIANASGNLTLVMQALLKQQGFYEQLGLDPSILDVADASKIMGAVLGGDIDSSMISGFGLVFPAIAKGAGLKVIGGAALPPSFAVFSGKPGIKTLKDLEGRTVGVGALGALLHQLMVALLRKHDVDVAKVHFVNIGSSGDVFRATIQGTVDAGTGDVSVLDQPGKYPIHMIENGNMTLELTDYTFSGAWTSDHAIATKRDILVRSLASYARLYRFVQTPEAHDPFMKAWKTVFPNADAADPSSQWNFIRHYKPWAVDLALGETRIRYMQQLNVDLKIQDKVLPFAQVADMSLAKDALKLLA